MAATAAVSTLADASLRACTALSALCEVCSDEPNNARAVERIAVALLLTLDRSFSTTGRNEAMEESMVARRCSWSRMAARSCSARRCSVTSSWGGNPTAPGQWFVLGEHDTAVVCLNVVLLTLALCYPVEDFLHLAVDIAGKQIGRLAIFDQFFDRAAWLHDRGIKFVNFQIARIEQGDAALRVEHVQTLRHVVERGGKPTILLE